MAKSLRIKRLEGLWGDSQTICPHAFTLILDGRMVQDDPPCSCGGERITLIAACEEEPVLEESEAVRGRGVAARTGSL